MKPLIVSLSRKVITPRVIDKDLSVFEISPLLIGEAEKVCPPSPS
jgi:hypothetical protein